MSTSKPKKKSSLRTRPPAAHSLSAPSHPDSSTASLSSQTPSITTFSPTGTHLANVSLSLDWCRLKIYDVESGRAGVEWEGERGARVGSAIWAEVALEPAAMNGEVDSSPPSKKRRRKSSLTAPPGLHPSSPPAQTLLLLALSSPLPSLILFSPFSPSPLRILSHPACTFPPTALTAHPSRRGLVFSAHADGTIRIWDAVKSTLIATYSTLSPSSSASAVQAGFSALAVIPSSPNPESPVLLLAATHKIHLLSLPSPAAPSPAAPPPTLSPTLLATFAGHADPISSLLLVPSPTDTDALQFLSTAATDRFVQLWALPSPLPNTASSPPTEGPLTASLPLPSPVRCVSLSPTSPPHLLALSARTLALLPLPSPTNPSSPTKDTSKSPKKSKHAVPTLSPLSTITLTAPHKRKRGKDADADAEDAEEGVQVELAAAAFLAQRPGSVVLASLAGGVKPVFEVVKYLSDESSFIPTLSLSTSSLTSNLLSSTASGPTGPSQTRYAESNSLAVASGFAAPNGDVDDDGMPDKAQELDVEMAEMSLGERLAVGGGGVGGGVGVQAPRGGDDEDASDDEQPRRKDQPAAIVPIPATSLSRTLTQALHSGDTTLLESCLASTDPTLILTTVRRLPPQLAVPLLNACVERLGRGGRMGTGKGGGAAAGAERAKVLVEWVRAVLVCHTGFLMTVPDLITRLSDLYSTLTTRLALHPRLLTLSGRLDLVLSQIDLRASGPGQAPHVPEKEGGGGKAGKRRKNKKQQEGFKYVEGESSAEEGGGEVGVEKGEEEGSVEEVELGGESEEEEGEEEDADVDMEGGDDVIGSEDDEEDDEDDDDDISLNGVPNGFIDDIAEEDWDEEDEDEDESEE